MNAAAAIVVVLLANGGHWLSGREYVVRAQWALAESERKAIPPVKLVWQLEMAHLRLAGGTAELDSGASEPQFRIVCPEVRARVALHLNWRALSAAGGNAIASGTAEIEAYPGNLAQGWATAVGRNHGTLSVVDPAGRLDAALSAAGVPHARRSAVTQLALDRPSMVLVAGEALDGSLFEQAPLLAVARAGASVMVFRQSRVERLFGYVVAPRRAPRNLVWEADHPLLGTFTPKDCVEWGADFPTELLAVRLPSDVPALPLCHWPTEIRQGTGRRELAAIPIDALLVVKREGQGRLVLCQLPLDDWTQDPRSQLLLGAALDYLSTRPEPTPPAVRLGPSAPPEAHLPDRLPTIRIDPRD